MAPDEKGPAHVTAPGPELRNHLDVQIHNETRQFLQGPGELRPLTGKLREFFDAIAASPLFPNATETDVDDRPGVVR